MDLLDLIPGYRQAVERECDVRNAAFLDLSESVCGIEVAPLSLRRFLMLDGLGSPFVHGQRTPTLSDCVQFLWGVSPCFNPKGRGRHRLIRQCKRKGQVLLVVGISIYLRESLMDAPPTPEAGKGYRPSYYSWAAGFVDVLAAEYHWSEREILDMPMKRIFQYLKRLSRKHDSKTALFNPSDKVRSAWMKERNRMKAASN